MVTLFGSHVSGIARHNSDIDLLIDLNPSFRSTIGVQFGKWKIELSEKLGRTVSLVSENALSKYVKPFIISNVIVIFDRTKPIQPHFPDVPIFDKHLFRDKARLEHMRDSLENIRNKLQNRETSSINNDEKESIIRQLLLFSGHLKHLRPESVQALFNSSNQETNDWKALVTFLQTQLHQYFGEDFTILLNAVNHDILPLHDQINYYLSEWDSRFKSKLSTYFYNYFLFYSRNDKNSSENSQEFSSIQLSIKLTVEGTPLNALTIHKIEEGETNVRFVAKQIKEKGFGF